MGPSVFNQLRIKALMDMKATGPVNTSTVAAALRNHIERASRQGWTGFLFWTTLVAIALLLLASGYSAIVEADGANLRFALMGGLSGFGAPGLDAISAVILRNISARMQNTMLSFAAGMMLAASFFYLIFPGIDAAQGISANKLLSACIVVLGLVLWVVLMVGFERFVPHEHSQSGRKGPDTQRFNRVWLFVLAIT